jgi:hypothetical protein
MNTTTSMLTVAVSNVARLMLLANPPPYSPMPHSEQAHYVEMLSMQVMNMIR